MSVHNIRDFGAVGDGVTLDTAAIQSAIDACGAGGGGRVVVPAKGVYLSGTFTMRSHVELYIERGAVIEASGNLADYQYVQTAESHKGVGYPNLRESVTFIAANDCEDIAFSGGGVIDGGGRKFIVEEAEIYRGRSPTYISDATPAPVYRRPDRLHECHVSGRCGAGRGYVDSAAFGL